jgi:hypothetical protein
VVIVSIKTERKIINSAWLEKGAQGKRGNRKGRKIEKMKKKVHAS